MVRVGENDFNVFSGRCVHLGCAVSWMPDQRVYLSFAMVEDTLWMEGARGPPPAPRYSGVAY